jgi:hypothetical protein
MFNQKQEELHLIYLHLLFQFEGVCQGDSGPLNTCAVAFTFFELYHFYLLLIFMPIFIYCLNLLSTPISLLNISHLCFPNLVGRMLESI